MLHRWLALLPDAPGGTARAVGEDLLARYAEPQRHYHDGRHLTEVLDAVDRLTGGMAAGPAAAGDPAGDLDGVAVRLAAWFHDAVYDPQAAAGANEEASARLAEETLSRLGQPAARVAVVGALVRATQDHELRAGVPAGAASVLFDADLAILGAPAERYAAYRSAVRAEYAHVPDDLFRSGRAAILQGFLARPRIYRTEAAYAAWEARARTNLTAEIKDLSALPGRDP